jgi:tRNA(fMet)-specific endonuclease VapC
VARRPKIIVVESDLLIRVLRGNQAAMSWLDSLRKQANLACSVITSFEVLRGATDAQLQGTEKLIDSPIHLPVNEAIARDAASESRQFRKLNQTVEMADLLIGCTARQHGYPMATYNLRHHRLDGLVLLIP